MRVTFCQMRVAIEFQIKAPSSLADKENTHEIESTRQMCSICTPITLLTKQQKQVQVTFKTNSKIQIPSRSRTAIKLCLVQVGR